MKRLLLIIALLVGGASLVAVKVFLATNQGASPDAVLTQKPVPGAEQVGVTGSEVRYPSIIESTIGSNREKLVLTGTALRTKLVFRVYTIGSYLQEGVKVTSADELCNKDCNKQLLLIMESAITGKQMADAFKNAIRLSHPEPAFDPEIADLSERLQTFDIAKGDNVWLTYVPGMGLHVAVVGKLDLRIANPAFAKAIWEVYLGQKNLGEPIKTGLVSRLK